MLILGLSDDPQEIRSLMKTMGTKANVPIEPDEQTKLLDACLSQSGIVGGGVPGGKLYFISTDI
jgi:phosphomevalonate kinase